MVTNLSRPSATLPSEGRDQATGRETAGADSPLLGGEGLGVRSASGDDRIKVLYTINSGTVRSIAPNCIMAEGDASATFDVSWHGVRPTPTQVV
jgi:hypothetical protein